MGVVMKLVHGALIVVVVGLLTVASTAGDAGAATAGREAAVLVLPARYSLVQLGFDMARIRTVSLISYDTDPEGGSPLVYAWSVKDDDWIPIQLEDYTSGELFAYPARVLVFGDSDLPEALAQSPGADFTISRERGLDIVSVVNALDKAFDFSPREWQWLAKRHRLELKDNNAERRRYGRYGPPGTPPRRPSHVEGEELPPLKLESEPVMSQDESKAVQEAPFEKGDDVPPQRGVDLGDSLSAPVLDEPAWEDGQSRPEDK